jgi:hypothetical protein
VRTSPIETFSASLAGGCFVALTQLLTRDTLAPALRASVALFSITIPFLVIFALLPVPEEPFRELHAVDKLTWVLFTASSILALFGITCLFWFVCPLFGCAFTISALAAYGFLLFRVRR